MPHAQEICLCSTYAVTSNWNGVTIAHSSLILLWESESIPRDNERNDKFLLLTFRLCCLLFSHKSVIFQSWQPIFQTTWFNWMRKVYDGCSFCLPTSTTEKHTFTTTPDLITSDWNVFNKDLTFRNLTF